MTTRTVEIGFVLKDGMARFKEDLRTTASKACVSVYVHETPEQGTPRISVAVDAWSENEGSVNDYCDFYLQMIKGKAYDWSVLDRARSQYGQRLRAWYAMQNS